MSWSRFNISIENLFLSAQKNWMIIWLTDYIDHEVVTKRFSRKFVYRDIHIRYITTGDYDDRLNNFIWPDTVIEYGNHKNQIRNWILSRFWRVGTSCFHSNEHNDQLNAIQRPLQYSDCNDFMHKQWLHALDMIALAAMN